MAVRLGQRNNTAGMEVEERAEGSSAGEPRIPQGLRALFRDVKKGEVVERVQLKDDERVRIANCSLTIVHVRIPDTGFQQEVGKKTEIFVEVKPGGSIEVPVQYAKRHFRCQEKPGGDSFMVLCPPDGDCEGKLSFQAFGRTWRTCYFGRCLTCGPLPPKVWWSVWQAQHRIGRLFSPEAISRFVEALDPRPDAVVWAMKVKDERLKAKQEQLGVVATRSPEDVVF